MARRIVEACKQRARDFRSPVSIAVVDAGGHLVLFERMMAPYGWITSDISIAKAATAVMFNQSTDAVAQWGASIPGFASSLSSMTNGKFVMAAGGWPVRVGGVTIGGIGISGGNAPGRDDEIARAGLAAIDAAPATPVPPTHQQAYTGALTAQPVASYPPYPQPYQQPYAAPQTPRPKEEAPRPGYSGAPYTRELLPGQDHANNDGSLPPPTEHSGDQS
jgi:uncharacterized protein GlcG (DUF336 family)